MVVEKLEKIFADVFYKLNYKLDDVKIIKSNRPDLCDYQCDQLFLLAKQYHKSPKEIGEEVVDELNKISNFNYYFKNINFVNPGFINIILSDEFITDILIDMDENPKFNIKKPSSVELYFLDYGGPNIAKPLHVGHIRTAILGESIKRIIEFMGHKTISDVHLGDYGLQIGQVIYGIICDNKKEEDIDLSYLEQTYPRISALCKEDENVLKKCRLITSKLQKNDEYYSKLWKKICEISIKDIKRIYNYLDVSFDLWQGESDSYKYIDDTYNYLNNLNLIYESDGAKVIDVQKEGDLKEIPPLIFQKSDGAYLYGTTDLSTIYERVYKYKPDYILYIVDNRQELHFNQVFRVCERSKLTENTKLEYLGYGTVNGMDGRPYKTRSGDAPKLDDLFDQIKDIFTNIKDTNKDMDKSDIDKIVNSIIKFADLQNNRTKDYIFDINKFSEVVGKTGPYILYTYLRINKIIENQKYDIKKIKKTIYNDIDRNLRLKMLELHNYINFAFKDRMPSFIAEYIYDLCVLINSFYQTNHINGLEDEDKKNEWIFILTLSCKILKEMLNLLSIQIPTKM